MKKIAIPIIIICLMTGCANKDLLLYRIQADNLFGFIDSNGEVIIKPTFTFASDFRDGLAYARIDSAIGYIDKKGNFKFSAILLKEKDLWGDSVYIIPFYEQNPFEFYESGFHLVLSTAEAINKPSDSDIEFSDGLALFFDTRSLKYGYVNKRGKFKIAPIYSNGGRFINGLARVKIDGKYGFINLYGDFIIEPKYTNVFDFSENLATAILTQTIKLDNGYTQTSTNCYVLNTLGNIVQEPQGHLIIDNFKEGYAVVNNYAGIFLNARGKTFVDVHLKMKTEEYFEDAKDFSEGYAAIKINGKWGFINSSFNHFLDIKYSDAKSFSEELAAVRNNYFWGYLSKTNKMAIDFKYKNCTSFKNGLAYVWLENNGFKTEGYINKTGNLIWFIDGK